MTGTQTYAPKVITCARLLNQLPHIKIQKLLKHIKYYQVMSMDERQIMYFIQTSVLCNFVLCNWHVA